MQRSQSSQQPPSVAIFINGMGKSVLKLAGGTGINVSDTGTVSATFTPPTGAANLVYATPNGSSGPASLRKLVVADLPNPVDIGTF